MPDPAPLPATAASARFTWQVRGHAAEAVLTPPAPGSSPDDVARTAGELVALAERLGSAGVALHLAADHPADHLDPDPEAVADAAGLSERRDLLQLRRPLPLPADHPTRERAPRIATRPFVPGGDDDAWLRVNNRAFADHPDQGREDRVTLAARTAEPWFDPLDFLVADEPAGHPAAGELAGFCWTKVDRAAAGPDGLLGEIYVIGVDPRHRGEGLGPAFVLAGLDHLASLSIPTAVLYVDADNEPARRLYDRLDFTTHQRRRVYSRPADAPRTAGVA